MGRTFRTWTRKQIMQAFDKSHFGGGVRDLSQFEAELDRQWEVSEEKRLAALRKEHIKPAPTRNAFQPCYDIHEPDHQTNRCNKCGERLPADNTPCVAQDGEKKDEL